MIILRTDMIKAKLKIIEEKGVAIVPGYIFGSFSADKLRISYATSMKNLEIAMDRIEDFTKSF